MISNNISRGCALCIAFGFTVLVMLLACSTGLAQAVENGLVAEWHFDEGTGSILGDSSGNGNDGTIYGAKWTPEGKFGSALLFDGLNDYVEVPDSPELSGGTGKDMTVEFWFNSNKLSGSIIRKYKDVSYKDWGAGIGFNGLFFYYEKGCANCDMRFYGGTVQEGVWHHGAFTFKAESSPGANDAELTLYLDGQKVDMNFWNDHPPYNVLPDQLYDMPDTNAPVGIGYNGNYYKSAYFDGKIDEIRVFDRVLTASEIKAEFEKGGYTAPTPVIINLNDGDTVSGTIMLEATTTEADVVSNLFEYSLDGVTWTEIGTDTDGSNGWNMEWDTKTVPNGNYDLRYTMTDVDGNQGSSQISVTVANQGGNAPIIEIIKPGVIFEGTFDQFNYGSYPMIMEITSVDGLNFNGILHWPTLWNSKTKFRGSIDAILNQIWFTEYELIQGSNIVLNGNYYAELQGTTLNGYWNWPDGGKGGTFSITMRDTSNLVISELLPEHDSHIGSTSVHFSWRTNLDSTSELFIKRQDETTYSRYTGNTGTFHSITVDSLLRNTWYNFYVSSGSKESEVRNIYIDNGIEFTQKSYYFSIERDYSQQATVTVQNTDNEPHNLLVSVKNPYDDLIVGFIGDGSQDQEITLNPGESRDITLSIFAQDAMLSEYQLQLDLNSVDSNINDHATAILNVRQPNIDFTITEIGADPYTLTKTFQVTNNGDRITDFSIFDEDGLEDRVLFKPAIIHANVGSGESLTFKLVPLLEFDTPITGFINATGAGHYERTAVDFSQSGGKTLFTSVLSDVTICMGTNSWYCTNRPNIRNTLSIPPGFDSSDVEAVVLAIDFSLPWSESSYRNHNVDISLNGHLVKSLKGIVPNGLYLIPVDPSFLNYGSGGTGVNQIDINTKHLNGGHYVVATNIEFRLKLKQLTTKLFADSQGEADNVVKNLDILCNKCVPKTQIISVDFSPPQLEAFAGQDVTFDVNVNLKNVQYGVLQVDVFKGDSLVAKSFRDVVASPETTETFTISFKAPDVAGSHEYKILTRFREGANGELVEDSFCDMRQQSTYTFVVTVPVKPQDKTLVKVEGQLEAYWFQNNKLYHVTAPEIISKMSGIQGWENVNSFHASVFYPANYEQGPSFITTGTESDGLLIREVGDYKVYRIESGKRCYITYPDVMYLKGYSLDDVIEVSSEISNIFQVGDPVGIEVDLYFNKLTDSGESPRESQFTAGDTIKFITETTVVEDYTVETYVRLTYPDGITKKYAYHENPDLSDQLKFSETERPFYPGTWNAETKTWLWNEFTFGGDETEGIYTWEFWYKDTASGKILGKDVQGYDLSGLPPRQKVQAFYYSWYGDPFNNGNWIHWNQNNNQPPDNIGADFYPILGPYSSKSADIVDQHMKWLKESGVGVIVISWWGKADVNNWNSHIDQSVPIILDKAQANGLKVAWHIEPYDEPYLKRTANTIKDDIKYIYDSYGNHPAFFRDSDNGNRAVFYIFESSGGKGSIPAINWASMLDSIRGTEYDSIVMAQTTDKSIISSGHFDGFYTYALHYTTSDWVDLAFWADANGKIFAPSVGPGYIDNRAGGNALILDRKNGHTYDEKWQAAITAFPQRVSITSFNEWHEGSQIEPADPNKVSSDSYEYLDYRPNLNNFYLMKTRFWIDQFIGMSDDLPPSIEIASPASDSTVLTKVFSFTINDKVAVNAGTLQVKINGVSSSTFDLVTHCTSPALTRVYCSYTENGIVDGTNTITVNVQDVVGNKAPTASTTFNYNSEFTFAQITDVHIGFDAASWDPKKEEELKNGHSIDRILRFVDTLWQINLEKPKPKFLLITGDDVHQSNELFFQTFNEILKFSDIPSYSIAGNHDSSLSGDCNLDDGLANYHKYINSQDNYNFDYGEYRFIGLYSGKCYDINKNFFVNGLTTMQIDQLKSELVDNTKKQILFMHTPLIDLKDDIWYGENSNTKQAFIDYIKNDNNNVQLVISGHYHFDEIRNSDDELEEINSPERPLFVTTRSATLQGKTWDGYNSAHVDQHGYRIFRAGSSGVQIYPSKETLPWTKLIFMVFSPVDIHVYDSQNRHTGMSASGIEYRVPESFYFKGYEKENTSVPQIVWLYNISDNYFIKIGSNFTKQKVKKSMDSFNLTIRKQTKNSYVDINFLNVNILNTTNATILINQTSVNYTMYIDIDGDGMADQIREPDIIKDNTLPSSITNLNPTPGTAWINWTWTNPPDPDFNHTEVYFDGIFQRNTSDEYFNATGLIPNTAYTISTRTVDTSGNINQTWKNDTATTLSEAPPVITNLGTSPGTDGAVVTWETDKASDSVVMCGISTGDYPVTDSSSDMVLSHSVTLTGLDPDTLYYYVVKSTDPQGNSAESTEFTFRTLELADTDPPVIESASFDATTTIAGAYLHLTVSATDNTAVTTVTADGTPLSPDGDTWTGGITVPSDAVPGTHTVTIQASDAAGNTEESIVTYIVVIPAGGISVTSTPKPLALPSGTSGELFIKLTSTANFDDTVEITLDNSGLPSAYAADLAWLNRTSALVQVPAGETVHVPFTVNIPSGVLPGYRTFTDSGRSLGLDATSVDTGVIYVTS